MANALLYEGICEGHTISISWPEPGHTSLRHNRDRTVCHRRCVLTDKSEAELAKLGKPLHPGHVLTQSCCRAGLAWHDEQALDAMQRSMTTLRHSLRAA